MSSLLQLLCGPLFPTPYDKLMPHEAEHAVVSKVDADEVPCCLDANAGGLRFQTRSGMARLLVPYDCSLHELQHFGTRDKLTAAEPFPLTSVRIERQYRLLDARRRVGLSSRKHPWILGWLLGTLTHTLCLCKV